MCHEISHDRAIRRSRITTRIPESVLTATFRVLFVLVVLSHGRRRLVHFNVTEHPTAEWTARQLLEACALEEGPRYLIRDRDQVYGQRFSRQA